MKIKKKTKVSSKKPMFGTPEWHAKYKGRRRKGKRGSTAKKLRGEVKYLTQIVKSLARAQGVKVPAAARKKIRRRRR